MMQHIFVTLSPKRRIIAPGMTEIKSQETSTQWTTCFITSRMKSLVGVLATLPKIITTDVIPIVAEAA